MPLEWFNKSSLSTAQNYEVCYYFPATLRVKAIPALLMALCWGQVKQNAGSHDFRQFTFTEKFLCCWDGRVVAIVCPTGAVHFVSPDGATGHCALRETKLLRFLSTASVGCGNIKDGLFSLIVKEAKVTITQENIIIKGHLRGNSSFYLQNWKGEGES